MKTKVTQPTEKMLLCGKRVAECRKEMGYSQEQLIEEIMALPENNGKPRNEKQISYIESGSRTLSIEYAHLIAKVLHVNESYLLGESEYKTDSDQIKAVAQSTTNEDIACYTFMEALGYKFIDLKISPNGTKTSMHKRFKYLKINTDDTDEQILEKARDAEPVRYYIIEDPEGRRAHINLDDLIRMQQAIRDYTIFQLEQPFKRKRQIKQCIEK
ncbi:helix-turn-helix domain-containing protein [Blautia obeum]|uniref:helix-turn-helix domain-containing protein n=1 Tax=Blautia obeum TaxID=40520 RepID=UPI0022E3FB64|nr:helix-turn-helix transcriptional regulator [Blautia obeum]